MKIKGHKTQDEKVLQRKKNNKVLVLKPPLGLKELSDLIIVLISLITWSLHISSKFERDMIVITRLQFLVPNTNSSDQLETTDYQALPHCYN